MSGSHNTFLPGHSSLRTRQRRSLKHPSSAEHTTHFTLLGADHRNTYHRHNILRAPKGIRALSGKNHPWVGQASVDDAALDGAELNEGRVCEQNAN
jgi:hypothetical protein